VRIDDDGLDQRERHGAGQCPMSRVQALGRLAEVGNASRRQRQVPVRMSAPDDATVGIVESGPLTAALIALHREISAHGTSVDSDALCITGDILGVSSGVRCFTRCLERNVVNHQQTIPRIRSAAVVALRETPSSDLLAMVIDCARLDRPSLAPDHDLSVVLVEIIQNGRRRTLLVDVDYLRLARTAYRMDRSLVDGIDLPRSALLGIAALWPEDWVHHSAHDARIDVMDTVPHLVFGS
jgi:hypothetical protein